MRRTVPALSIAAALLLGSACTPAIGGATAPAPVSTAAADPVTWADSVCTTLQPFADVATVQPQTNASDPAASLKALSGYLGTAVTTLDSVLSNLSKVGPAPVTSGDLAVTKLISALKQYRSTFAGVRKDVDAVDPTNPQDLVTALPAALAPLEKLQSSGNPLADLKSDPELDRAVTVAPNCKKLDAAG